MTPFSSWQYLMIDVANNFGLDKLLFEERIEWAQNNLKELESLADKAETQPLYLKAVQAVRKAQKGIPTGHLVGFDATCSGIQVMSALTGCVAGATATGLVDPNVRADAYTACTQEMNNILGGGVTVSRKDAKSALMTSFYGSKETPKEIFGADTPELNAFYQAARAIAPGAWELLQDLLASWQPYATFHAWQLPDGYNARVKVMEKVSARIEVDELDHSTFTYEFYENIGSKKGLSNAANVVHSVDAFILREVHRRCNYDELTLMFVEDQLVQERNRRQAGAIAAPDMELLAGTQLEYYLQQYQRSQMPSAVIIPELLDARATEYLSDRHLEQMIHMVEHMREHQSFEVVTIHDEFKCSPVNMNHLRQHYIDIFAELADSEVLSDILSQIHGRPGTWNKLSNNLSQLIRGSNYALC